jgi:hypothetical protein
MDSSFIAASAIRVQGWRFGRSPDEAVVPEWNAGSAAPA